MSKKSNLSNTILAVAIHFLCNLLDQICISLRDVILNSKFLGIIAVDFTVYIVILFGLLLFVSTE